MKRFERLREEKLGGDWAAVVRWKKESVRGRRLMGGRGFGGFLNQLSKGLKLMEAIGGEGCENSESLSNIWGLSLTRLKKWRTWSDRV